MLCQDIAVLLSDKFQQLLYEPSITSFLSLFLETTYSSELCISYSHCPLCVVPHDPTPVMSEPHQDIPLLWLLDSFLVVQEKNMAAW